MADSTLIPRGDATDGPRKPIEVQINPSEAPGYAALVKLCGEHDLATAVEVQDALDAIYGSVLVDLADCEFIDSTVISVLVRDSQARQREGHLLELLMPNENSPVARTLTVVGLPDLIPVHARPPGG
jgi:anti-anti-sigma factor